MTPTKTTADPERLQREAADLAAQAAAATAKVAAAHASDQARRGEHQKAYDERLVASYRASDHDATVTQARREKRVLARPTVSRCCPGSGSKVTWQASSTAASPAASATASTTGYACS